MLLIRALEMQIRVMLNPSSLQPYVLLNSTDSEFCAYQLTEILQGEARRLRSSSSTPCQMATSLGIRDVV